MAKSKNEKVVVVTDATAIKELETSSKAIEKVKAFSIVTKTDYDKAENALKLVVGYRARVADVFDEQLSSAKATVKAINKQIKRFDGPAAEIESDLRSSMSVFLTAEREKAELVAEKVRAKEIKKAERRGDDVAVAELESAPLEIEKTVGDDMSERKNWYAVVVDSSKLPKDYWLIDQKRLDAEARTNKELFNVPGAVAKYTVGTIVHQ